jgi:hypothetical protein
MHLSEEIADLLRTWTASKDAVASGFFEVARETRRAPDRDHDIALELKAKIGGSRLSLCNCATQPLVAAMIELRFAFSAQRLGETTMPTFVTSNREVARKFRTAYLTGRTIDGDFCGQSFPRAKVCSIKRDALSVTGRWRIRIEQEEDDSTPAGLVVVEP